MKPYHLLLIATVLFGLSCSEDDDPTLQPSPPTFGISTLAQVEDSLFAEDTFIIATSDVFFAVDGKGRYYDSVAWRVGNDPRRFTEKQFNLTFEEKDAGNISVELTIWPTPSEFFPEDTALYFEKTIHIMPRTSPYAFEGTFRGSNASDPERMFEVTVINFGVAVAPYYEAQYWLHLFNLTEGCGGDKIDQNKFIPTIEWASYSHFYVHDDAIISNNCQEIEGYGKVDASRDTLTIDYEYRVDGTTEYRNDRFIGIRIIP